MTAAVAYLACLQITVDAAAQGNTANRLKQPADQPQPVITNTGVAYRNPSAISGPSGPSAPSALSAPSAPANSIDECDPEMIGFELVTG